MATKKKSPLTENPARLRKFVFDFDEFPSCCGIMVVGNFDSLTTNYNPGFPLTLSGIKEAWADTDTYDALPKTLFATTANQPTVERSLLACGWKVIAKTPSNHGRYKIKTWMLENN